MTGGHGGGFQPEDILEIVERRRWWIVIGAVSGLALGLLLYLVLPPTYESRTSVLVEPQEVPEAFIRSTITPFDFKHRLATLQDRVTSHENLDRLIDAIGAERLDPAGNLSREQLMGVIRGGLSVSGGTGGGNRRMAWTTVFEVGYTARDPQLAADVARAVTESFIEENLRDRSEQAAETASFLDQELEKLRLEVESQEEKIRAFRFERMGSLPSQLETNLRGLDRLNLELASNLEAQTAESQRIALLRRQLDELRANAPTVMGSPSDVQQLLAAARTELVQLELIYTDDHPNVQALRERIRSLEQRLARQPRTTPDPGASRLALASPAVTAVRSELGAAQMGLDARKREEAQIRQRIQELQARVDETPEREQEIADLTRDYTNLTKTYHELLGKKYEASLARNLELAKKGERFKLLRPDRVPGSPVWPDPMLLLPGGLGAGLACVALLILVTEIRNPAFRSVNRLTRSLGLPVFASIPHIDRDDIYEELPTGDIDPKLVVYTAPESSPAEQYRGFLPILLDAGDCRVILVTSAARGDGKTLTCMNLAASVAADLNKRVLVIDSDLRRPSAHKLLRLSRRRGLSDILEGRADIPDCAINSKIPNLTLLAAGPSVRNPLTLLTSPAFFDLLERAKKDYHLIFIDSPPLLPVVDTKILRKIADMVLFVVRADGTPRDAAVRSLHELRDAAGVVFNQVSPGAFRRHYYYDAYSRYAYGDDVVEEEEHA